MTVTYEGLEQPPSTGCAVTRMRIAIKKMPQLHKISTVEVPAKLWMLVASGPLQQQ